MKVYKYRATKYYKARLWKISYVAAEIGGGKFRLVKHYERKSNLGIGPYKLIRSVVCESTIRP